MSQPWLENSKNDLFPPKEVITKDKYSCKFRGSLPIKSWYNSRDYKILQEKQEIM